MRTRHCVLKFLRLSMHWAKGTQIGFSIKTFGKNASWCLHWNRIWSWQTSEGEDLLALAVCLSSSFGWQQSEPLVIIVCMSQVGLNLAVVSSKSNIFSATKFKSCYWSHEPQKGSPSVLLQAILDAWNNPYARSLLLMSSPPTATPYDQSVAKLLVQKLNLDPGTIFRQMACRLAKSRLSWDHCSHWSTAHKSQELDLIACNLIHISWSLAPCCFIDTKSIYLAETAVRDVDLINLALDGFGAFSLLASGAATSKYLLLKRQPAKGKVQKKDM